MKYTTEKLEAIAAKLRAMPAVEKKNREHSRREAVQLLSKEITSLKNKGYTIEQIAESLNGEGLSIATPTLRSYLQQKKSNKRTTKDTPHRPAPPKGNADGLKSTFTPKSDSDEI